MMPQALEKLREVVAAIRKDLLLKPAAKSLIDREKEAQLKEVSHWLTVWLQSPELFSDWLDLRRRSPEFRKRFETTSPMSKRMSKVFSAPKDHWTLDIGRWTLNGVLVFFFPAANSSFCS